jgi:hypothetical protein
MVEVRRDRHIRGDRAQIETTDQQAGRQPSGKGAGHFFEECSSSETCCEKAQQKQQQRVAERVSAKGVEQVKRSARDPEAYQLAGGARLALRCELERILTRRKPRKWQIELAEAIAL